MHEGELLTISLTLGKVLVKLEEDLANVLLLMQLQNFPLGVTDHHNPQVAARRTIINNPEAFLKNALQPEDTGQRGGHDVSVINMHRDDDGVVPTPMNEEMSV